MASTAGAAVLGLLAAREWEVRARLGRMERTAWMAEAETPERTNEWMDE